MTKKPEPMIVNTESAPAESPDTAANSLPFATTEPDINTWLKEAKNDSRSSYVGMYLTHNGVVRATPKQVVRPNKQSSTGSAALPVIAVDFSYDKQGLEQAVRDALTWKGIYYVRVWLNEGVIPVGGSLMYVLIGADIRPNAVEALTKLVGHIKNDLVSEIEIYDSQTKESLDE